MKRIIYPLLGIAALAPLTATAALITLGDPSATADQASIAPQTAEHSGPDLLNDPEPFRLNPAGLDHGQLTASAPTLPGTALLYVADEKKDARPSAPGKVEAMKKAEAKIRELKQAGKLDEAAAIAKKLDYFRELTKRDDQSPAPGKKPEAARRSDQGKPEGKGPDRDHPRAHGQSGRPQAGPPHPGQGRPPFAQPGGALGRPSFGGPQAGPPHAGQGRPPFAQPGGSPMRPSWGAQRAGRPGAPHPSSPRPPRAGSGFRGQLHGAGADAHQKLSHLRAAMMHLRAAGVADLADRIEQHLKAHGANPQGQLRDQSKGTCPDCAKSDKPCPECAKSDKPCPDCAKSDKPCPDCEGAHPVVPSKKPSELHQQPAPRNDKAIGELQSQVAELRKQVNELRAKAGIGSKSDAPKEKAAPKHEAKPAQKKKEEEEKKGTDKKDQKTSASGVILIEL